MAQRNPQAADAVHVAMQKAINLIEAKVTGQPLDLDGVADLDELPRVTLALVTIGDSLVRSFDRPTAEVIDALRLMCMTAVD
ncbi:hypothetical protein [Geodermatophilus sp. SYSU D01105]